LFLQNLIKLIPVEIIAIFVIINGFIPTTANPISVWIVLGVLMLLVPFYVIFAMGVKKWSQVVLMTFAFPIWILATGSLPVMITLGWYDPWMMSVALSLFTLIPPMFYGKRVTVEEVPLVTATKSKAKTKVKAPVIPPKSWRECL